MGEVIRRLTWSISAAAVVTVIWAALGTATFFLCQWFVEEHGWRTLVFSATLVLFLTVAMDAYEKFPKYDTEEPER